MIWKNFLNFYTYDTDRKQRIFMTEKKNKIKNPNEFHIGTYYLAPYARTDKHIQEMSESGIDFVINIPNDPLLLDQLHNCGVSAIVNGVFPSWFGGDGSNAGTMAKLNPMEKYQTAAKNFCMHPAIWGIDVGDEPSILEFDHYSKVFDLINQNFPVLHPYLNLYPTYAVKGNNTPEEIRQQLGTDSHEYYIDSFCQKISSDYICFDYYLYSASLEGFYQSLKNVSCACKKHGRKLWTVLQVNSHDPNLWISANQLRIQAFTAMAFGASTIIWACYTAGWWYHHVLDKDGKKTEQYEKLKEVNTQIHALGNEFMKYRHLETHFIGFFPLTSHQTKERLSLSFVSDLKAVDNQALLVGEMELSPTRHGLFLFAANDPSDENQQILDVTFASHGNKVSLFSYHREQSLQKNGENFLLRLPSSYAVFLTFDNT